MKQKVLITGGTGLTGRHLIAVLKDHGHGVSVLSRSVTGKETSVYHWNPGTHEMDRQALQNTDAIIHLAGASIAGGRWTKKYKEAIVDSRVKSTTLLYESLKQNGSGVKTFISASAVGIYGDGADRWMDEDSPASNDFLGDTCRQWETEVNKIAGLGIRVVILRVGLVLAMDGGILPVIARPLIWGLGSILGNGNQFMSWIHRNDLGRIYLKAIEDVSMQGIYNAVAPNPVKHREFMQTLARVYHRPIWLPDVPSGILKFVLGEKAGLVLDGQRVRAKKIMDAGFVFEFQTLEPALKDLKKKS